jgi:hypothetical protein
MFVEQLGFLLRVEVLDSGYAFFVGLLLGFPEPDTQQVFELVLGMLSGVVGGDEFSVSGSDAQDAGAIKDQLDVGDRFSVFRVAVALDHGLGSSLFVGFQEVGRAGDQDVADHEFKAPGNILSALNPPSGIALVFEPLLGPIARFGGGGSLTLKDAALEGLAPAAGDVAGPRLHQRLVGEVLGVVNGPPRLACGIPLALRYLPVVQERFGGDGRYLRRSE